MAKNEATARIKINALLEKAGWRFFAKDAKPANIVLEQSATLKQADIDSWGKDFEKTKKGYIDFLLLDAKGHPLIVLEAKAEAANPLAAKEQARRYARSQNCRFVMLSNGNLHYFWDLQRGDPYIITSFPAPESISSYKKIEPKPERLLTQEVKNDYIVLTQRPNYAAEAAWKNEDEKEDFVKNNKLRFLRDYQQRAVHSIQDAVKKGKDRFLFEMATGTGKTLTTAAVIKLFLHTGNAHRVLFLVDRLELEEQARKTFRDLLSVDFQTVIYKEKRNEWRRAEIVISTVQSLLADNKYNSLFSPTDFDLIISDEAHRSIGGNARAVFEYFVGYKLGLTATPREYLKGSRKLKDPRAIERRMLLDTYRTFGCEDGQPTFRYSLLDGVKDGVLISPTVVDARTEITTELLSKDGFIASYTDDRGDEQEESFKQRQFEKRFFSESTNKLFCKTFLEGALRDPISREIGKSIIFAVSQEHAAKLTQILNAMAERMFPGKYQSDFAVQVTSQVQDAQDFTVHFANNNLLGTSGVLPNYKTSKARVCVTVGMMTTGYDCPDILNLALFRPLFSPTDFIQIKGRGTRTHDFREQLTDRSLAENIERSKKTQFKLFDFFGNCQYFEKDFNYDEMIKLPSTSKKTDEQEGLLDSYEFLGKDFIDTIKEESIGYEGMKVDRMFFDNFADIIRTDKKIAIAKEKGQWDYMIDYVHREIFDKPEDYFNLKKLRKALGVDRRLSLREILERIFGLIPDFKSKDKLLEEEFAKFIAGHPPKESKNLPAVKVYFKAYILYDDIRHIIEKRDYAQLATNASFPLDNFKAVPKCYRELVPEYVKDYVSLNQFAA